MSIDGGSMDNGVLSSTCCDLNKAKQIQEKKSIKTKTKLNKTHNYLSQ